MADERARTLARARLVLRLSIQTHKRSIAAHRRALGELKGALSELEDQCEASGDDLPNAESEEDRA